MQDRQIWMAKIADLWVLWKENCPFCQDNKNIIDNTWIIKKFKYWEIKRNIYPYNWVKNHLLLIPFRHIENTKFLTKEELGELSEVYDFLEKFFEGENYFSFIRETNWWKSIKHIHYHYLPWVLYSHDLEKIMEEQHKNLEKF